MTHKCKNCGECFYPKSKTQKFCSSECRSEYYNKSKKQPHTSYCKECGKKFQTVLDAQCFCSNICSRRFHRKKYKKDGKFVEGVLKTRFKVFMRDDFRCVYCGRSPKKHGVTLEVEHIIPKAKGGTDCMKNYTTSCWECNRGKADILLEKRLIDKFQSVDT